MSDTQQDTQPATQAYSQNDGTRPDEDHLWGYLQPCSNVLHRIDFWKINAKYAVGRNPNVNHVVLPGLKISNRHCVIEWDGNQQNRCVIVRDLSTNGTFINGTKIGKGISRTMYEGNELSLGTAIPQLDSFEDYRFIFRFTAAGPPEEGIFAHYDVLEQLGQGSFATVFRVLHRATSSYHAAKFIYESRRTGGRQDVEQAKVNIGREIAIMQQLDHPNICKLREVFHAQGSGDLTLVLELVPGGDLLDLITNHGPLPNLLCQHIIYQACAALTYIHTFGVTHRDLKPENILLTKDEPPVVKIADFGLAKVVSNETMLRTMCGTPAYLAPEVVRQDALNQGYDNLVDSWSVGIILFGMFTNQSPIIEDETQPDMRMRILGRKVDLSAMQELDVPETAQDFVERLLDDNPLSRMNLATAMEHPWLLEYTPVWRFEDRVPVRLVPAEATVNGVPASRTSSQQSVVEDASMLDAAGSHMVVPTSNGGVGGGADGTLRSPAKFIQRRADIVALAREGQFDMAVMPEDVRYSNGLPSNNDAGPSNLADDAMRKRRAPSDEPMDEPMDMSPVKKHRDSLEDDSSSSYSSSNSKKGKGKTRVSDNNTQLRRSGRNAHHRGVAK